MLFPSKRSLSWMGALTHTYSTCSIQQNLFSSWPNMRYSSANGFDKKVSISSTATLRFMYFVYNLYIYYIVHYQDRGWADTRENIILRNWNATRCSGRIGKFVLLVPFATVRFKSNKRYLERDMNFSSTLRKVVAFFFHRLPGTQINMRKDISYGVLTIRTHFHG